MFRIGAELILTIQDAVFEHPFASVHVTVYVVAIVGFAVGLEIVTELKPEEGLQEYVVPPFAVSETLEPEQVEETGGVILAVGSGLTIT